MSAPRVDLEAIPGPIILAGDQRTAYRDPLLHYHDGIFRLFCSVVSAQPDGHDRFHVGVNESRDLRSPPRAARRAPSEPPWSFRRTSRRNPSPLAPLYLQALSMIEMI